MHIKSECDRTLFKLQKVLGTVFFRAYDFEKTKEEKKEEWAELFLLKSDFTLICDAKKKIITYFQRLDLISVKIFRRRKDFKVRIVKTVFIIYESLPLETIFTKEQAHFTSTANLKTCCSIQPYKAPLDRFVACWFF